MYLRNNRHITDDIYVDKFDLIDKTVAFTPEVNEEYIRSQDDPEYARGEVRRLMASNGLL